MIRDDERRAFYSINARRLAMSPPAIAGSVRDAPVHDEIRSDDWICAGGGLEFMRFAARDCDCGGRNFTKLASTRLSAPSRSPQACCRGGGRLPTKGRLRVLSRPGITRRTSVGALVADARRAVAFKCRTQSTRARRLLSPVQSMRKIRHPGSIETGAGSRCGREGRRDRAPTRPTSRPAATSTLARAAQRRPPISFASRRDASYTRRAPCDASHGVRRGGNTRRTPIPRNRVAAYTRGALSRAEFQVHLSAPC